ncbi:hypothetical protein OQJ26_10710 [Legionella sp. PATHC038]|uniref:hypothetical protein n=1 Tax=Legionella sheltonii TaxID=2992041 RepID=UPI00224384CC|nr:hypothetical protein [Legionella sp. PATHC038]MCW8399260.1 hypothetical protein [Legionella sp. PATHC038]
MPFTPPNFFKLMSSTHGLTLIFTNKMNLPFFNLLRESSAISFVEDLAAKLEIEREQVEKEIDAWSKILSREQPDFAKCSIEALDAHIIKNISPSPVREKILDLLHTGWIKDNFSTFNHSSFLANMKMCLMQTASWIICGGYVLLLQSEGIEKLKKCIPQTLGINAMEEKLTNEDKFFGILFLQQFIDNNPHVELNCDFFLGKDRMMFALAQQQEALSENRHAIDRIASWGSLRT